MGKTRSPRIFDQEAEARITREVRYIGMEPGPFLPGTVFPEPVDPQYAFDVARRRADIETSAPAREVVDASGTFALPWEDADE
jgi:hypothetical protein